MQVANNEAGTRKIWQAAINQIHPSKNQVANAHTHIILPDHIEQARDNAYHPTLIRLLQQPGRVLRRLRYQRLVLRPLERPRREQSPHDRRDGADLRRTLGNCVLVHQERLRQKVVGNAGELGAWAGVVRGRGVREAVGGRGDFEVQLEGELGLGGGEDGKRFLEENEYFSTAEKGNERKNVSFVFCRWTIEPHDK